MYKVLKTPIESACSYRPPILSLASRLEKLYQESESFECMGCGPDILALEDEIAENPATSLQEAAVQVMLASAYVERVREDLVEDTDETLKKIERLVRSALSALVCEAGLDLAEYGSERYVPAYTDPFRNKMTRN